ncbi:MAG: discoidin domain-containing protein, partial [Bacteroidetes bacterium]|nr:discoidin domain-containing protein [Bacteroidota bacterium]
MISIIPFLSALLLYTAPQTDPRPLLLDDFSTLGGWKTIVSDGAKLTLLSEPGIPGGCMVMEFDLTGGAGYVIAEKSFPIALPEDYQFTFDLRGDTPVNNFEFKVIDEHENVHWIKKLNITYPESWTKQRIKKRHLSYAWGPAPGKPLKHVRTLQFVVSAGTGGKGRVWIDNFRFEPRDANPTTAAARIAHGNGSIDASGSVVTLWKSTLAPDSLVIDFNRVKEFGGLVVDWDSAGFANAYDVQVSDDGLDWSSVYTVRRGKPGRAYVPCGEVEGRYVKLV